MRRGEHEGLPLIEASQNSEVGLIKLPMRMQHQDEPDGQQPEREYRNGDHHTPYGDPHTWFLHGRGFVMTERIAAPSGKRTARSRPTSWRPTTIAFPRGGPTRSPAFSRLVVDRVPHLADLIRIRTTGVRWRR